MQKERKMSDAAAQQFSKIALDDPDDDNAAPEDDFEVVVGLVDDVLGGGYAGKHPKSLGDFMIWVDQLPVEVVNHPNLIIAILKTSKRHHRNSSGKK
jgi:hypothetical protein